MTRAVLSGLVAAAVVVSSGASAQSQSIKISQQVITPDRLIPSLNALPQITAEELAAPRVALPFRNLDDPSTFAARKAEAATMRLTRDDGVTPAGAPVQLTGSEPLTVGASPVFDGTSNADCGVVTGLTVKPADQGLAVGNTLSGGPAAPSVVQGINICISVFDKNGVLQAGYPKSTASFLGAGGLNTSDPRVIFDWIGSRYIFVMIAYPASCSVNCTSAATYRVAVSTSSDPTAGWCLYTLPVATGPNPSGGFYSLPDYPRLGQDREAIYLASNLYRPSYLSEEILALPKSGLYACAGFGYTTVTGFGALSGNGFTIQPANVFSPADQPKSMYFVTSFQGAATTQLVVSALHSPFGSPSFTQVIINAPNTYSTPPDASQQGSGVLINTGDQRITGTPFYAAGSIYAALTTNGGNGQPGMTLYQIQPFVDTSGGANDGKITGARVLNEIRHFGAGSNAFYYPAQQPDGEGNVTTVFSFSSSTFFPSLAYVSRRAAQAVGTLPDPGIFAQIGAGPYTGGRWGDYWATAPAGIVSGGGTGSLPKMWFAGMYATAGNNWGTKIGRTGYTDITQD